jgi:Skp family chaperone for outer membrane proteins
MRPRHPALGEKGETTMTRWIAPTLTAVAFTLAAPHAAAQPDGAAQTAPLAPDVLARCAAQVQQLREESARLAQKSAEVDVRRNAINERSAALKAERDALKPEDLQGGLTVRQHLQDHHAQTLAFNAEVEKLKGEIRQVNVLKRDYDGTCANRSYRRADLDALPESARNAMRVGLGGVQVPFIE